MKSQKQGLADLQSFGVLYSGVDVDEGLMVFSQSESVLVVSPRIEFQSIVV